MHGSPMKKETENEAEDGKKKQRETSIYTHTYTHIELNRMSEDFCKFLRSIPVDHLLVICIELIELSSFASNTNKSDSQLRSIEISKENNLSIQSQLKINTQTDFDARSVFFFSIQFEW